MTRHRRLQRIYEHLQDTVGTLPSVAVVGASIAIVLACGLLLSRAAGQSAAVAMLAVLVFYCLMRPSGGWSIFGISTFPSAASVIPADIFDIPRLAIGGPLIPIMLLLLVGHDREDRERRAGST